VRLLQKRQFPFENPWVQALYGASNWVQNGCNFEMYKKEKSCKSLTYRTLSNALQDGLVIDAVALHL
jgi:hypothetical protein